MHEYSIAGDEVSVIPEDIMSPDTAEESELLITLEQTLRDLEDISSNIEENAGVSRNTAEALNNIDPAILPETLALESFTITPSMVNYKATLEAIDFKSKWLVGGVVAAAFAIIAKIIHWIWKSLTGDKTKETPSVRADAASETIKTVTEAKADLIFTAKDNDRQLAEHMKQVEKDYMNKLEDSLHEHRNDLMYEIATDGRIIRLVSDLSKHFLAYGKAFSSSMDDYLRIFKEHENDTEDNVQVAGLLSGAAMDIPVKTIAGTLALIGAGTRKEGEKFTGATKLIKEYVDKLSNSKTKPTPSGAVLLAMAKANKVKDAAGYLNEPEDAGIMLQNLQEKVDGIESISKLPKANVKAFERAAQLLRENVEAMARIHQVVYKVIGVNVKLMEQLATAESGAYVAMLNLGKQSEFSDKFEGFDKKLKKK